MVCKGRELELEFKLVYQSLWLTKVSFMANVVFNSCEKVIFWGLLKSVFLIARIEGTIDMSS